MQKLTRHQGAKTLAAALFALVGPSAFAITKAYTFGATLDDPTSKNGNAEGNAAVLRTEAGIDLSATAKKATSPANTLITVADKDFTSPTMLDAEIYQQQPLFAIDVFKAAAGKKSEDIARINILSTTAAAKKALMANVDVTEAIEPAARLLQVLGSVEVTGVYFKTDGSQLDIVDAKVKELAAQGVFVLGAVSDDSVMQGDKRVVMAGDDAWTKARAKMLGGSNLLLADDEAAPDFDISGTYGKLATSGLGAARTQTAVFAWSCASRDNRQLLHGVSWLWTWQQVRNQVPPDSPHGRRWRTLKSVTALHSSYKNKILYLSFIS